MAKEALHWDAPMPVAIVSAAACDLDAIIAFLRCASHEKLLPRPAEDYRRAIDAGLFCVARSGTDLVAVAGAFVLSDDPALIEMGSCCVAPQFRGFGLQKLLVRARIAASIARVGPEARILTAVTPHNAGSLASVLNAGFEPLTEQARHLLELCGHCATPPAGASGRLCCCDFFHIPASRRRSEIAALLRPGPITASRTDGARIAVGMALDVLEAPHRAALERFALAPEPLAAVGG